MPELDTALRATLRCSLALLWLAAASHKLRNPARFREAIAGYQLAPAVTLRALAAGIPALELALGIWLLSPGAGAAPALATGALLALYAIAIAANLLRGRRSIDCGCGVHPQPLGEGLVVRNALLVAIALAAALPANGRALVGLDTATIAGGAIALTALYAAADGALGNRSRARRATA